MKLIVDCAQKLQQLGERVFNEKKQETYEPIDEPTIATDFTKEHGIPCPDGYIFKDENGNVINATKIILEKKKQKYPQTYEECCKVLMGKTDFQDFELVLTKLTINRSEENSISPEPPYIRLINVFYKLLICRDAYWKIAGEEMGLGKPWKPDWKSLDPQYIILYQYGGIDKAETHGEGNYILTFPTAEMRDAFKENFDPNIEICKELL